MVCVTLVLRLPVPPTAIFTCNNKMTLGLMQALTETGVRCPEYISVLSFDDFPWSSHFTPHLTAIAQPSLEIGRRAFQLLLDAMNSKDKEPGESTECVVKLEAELKIRQSTAPPRPAE